MRHCHQINPRMEALVTDILRRVGDFLDGESDAERVIAAVVLGGGYGRGEGGIFGDLHGGERLYNDVDLFVFIRDGASREEVSHWQGRLDGLEKTLSAEFQVEVEFGPLTGIAKLKALSDTLMYQELIRSWYPVWGDGQGVMAKLRERSWELLNPLEGLRLLLNRGAGLLLARWQLDGDAPVDRDFVIRNIHKAALGIGDAHLIARKNYCFGAEARLAHLAEVADFSPEALAAYRRALAFKFAPSDCPGFDVDVEWTRMRGLYLDELDDFLKISPTRIDWRPMKLIKTVLLNLCYIRPRQPGAYFHHPRVHLVKNLPSLLLAKDCDMEYIKKGANFNYDLQSEEFARLWRRFN